MLSPCSADAVRLARSLRPTMIAVVRCRLGRLLASPLHLRQPRPCRGKEFCMARALTNLPSCGVRLELQLGKAGRSVR